MPHLLILPRLRSSFDRSIRPLLRARGLHTEQGTTQLLDQLLQDHAQFWVFPLNRPRYGVLRDVELPARADVVALEELKDRESVFLLPVDDCLLELALSLAPDKRQPATLRVGGAFGRKVAAEVLPALSAPAPATESERHLVLMLTTTEITVLLEVSPAGDAFIACEMWPNEQFPLGLLSHRRSFYLPEAGEVLKPVSLDWENGIWFACRCETCAGGGKVCCHVCVGSGEVTCRGVPCRGTGVFRAAMPCRKCEGKGYFIGNRGDRMTCRPCGGSGHFPQKNCLSCGGTGKRQCPVCTGAKTLPCRTCAGAGSTRVNFDPVEGIFSQRHHDETGRGDETRLSSELVYLFDRAGGSVLAPAENAPALREKLCQAFDKADRRENAFEPLWLDHVRTISGLTNCLTVSLDAAGRREDGAVRVGWPEASTHRSGSGLCVDFRVRNHNKKWVEEGLLPFPEAGPVKLFALDDPKFTHPLPLPLQGERHLSEKDAAAEVASCHGEGDTYRLTLRFPRTLDLSRLPIEFFIRLDAPPAAELAQKRVLALWCGPENRDFPALNAIVLPPEAAEAPRLPLFEGRIQPDNPAQGRALALALSDAPLSLVKGPPGTGKTTLITEIVNQLTAIGGRVLVCSQSHDAVRNVLDNLDRKRKADPANALRMLRHGREEKLSQSELFYSEDQLQRNYPDLVRARTGGRQAVLAARVESLTALAAAVNRALEAKLDLDATRGRLAQHREWAQNEYQRQMEALQSEQDDGLARTGKSYGAETQSPVDNLRASGTRLADLRRQQFQLEQDAQKARERFQAKTGREPQVVPVPDGMKRKLRDSLIPTFLVGADVLEQRYSMVCAAWQECVQNVRAEEGAIVALEGELSTLAEQHAGREAVIRQHAEAGREIASRDLGAKLAAWQEEQTAEESRVATIVQHARDALPQSVNVEAADPPVATWQKLQASFTHEVETARREQAFNQAWLRELESPEAGSAVADIYFRHVQVYFATCVGVRSWKRLLKVPGGVDLVIVDEAGQATIPQTLGPMLLGKRALLIGDERQLPPIGLTGDMDLCRNACAACPGEPGPESSGDADQAAATLAPAVVMRPCWLERSFFEYLWLNQLGIPREMLQKQFRMHPDIADFVAAVFYPEGLTNGVTAEQRRLQFGEFSRAVCLVSTSGQRDRYESSPPGDRPGCWNDLEVEKIMHILQRAEAELVTETSFGIVTPYKHQVARLQTAVQPALQGFLRVRLDPQTDIASVDRFQGSERDVIIISFVRSPKLCSHCQGRGCSHCRGRGFRGPGLSFSRDLRRLNVAFSRARKMLILVGDIDALANPHLRGGRAGALVLEHFVKYVQDNGKVLHVWQTEDNVRQP